MSKGRAARTMPRMAGRQVYGQDDLIAIPGNSVYLHNQQYHVFVGLNKVLTTDDKQAALTEAAHKQII